MRSSFASSSASKRKSSRSSVKKKATIVVKEEKNLDVDEEIFKLMDQEKKGHLDQFDIQRLMQIFEKETDSPFALQIIKEAVPYGRQEVKFQDFKNLKNKKRAFKPTGDMLQAFRLFSGGDKQKITKADLESTLKTAGLHEREIRDIIVHLDFDSEGNFDFEKEVRM